MPTVAAGPWEPGIVVNDYGCVRLTVGPPYPPGIRHAPGCSSAVTPGVGALGAYIAAVSPDAVLGLLAHAEALEARVRELTGAAKTLLPMAFAFVEKRDGFEAADRFEARYFAILFGEDAPPVSRSEGAPK